VRSSPRRRCECSTIFQASAAAVIGATAACASSRLHDVTKTLSLRPRRRGGPPKLTLEIQKELVFWIRDGAFLSDACGHAGVHPNTVRRWLLRGEATDDEPYASFARAIRVARAKDSLRATAIIVAAADRGDWYAARWLLEHHHAGTYGAARASTTRATEPDAVVRFYAVPTATQPSK
jgi:hypothetical protein